MWLVALPELQEAALFPSILDRDLLVELVRLPALQHAGTLLPDRVQEFPDLRRVGPLEGGRGLIEITDQRDPLPRRQLHRADPDLAAREHRIRVQPGDG